MITVQTQQYLNKGSVGKQNDHKAGIVGFLVTGSKSALSSSKGFKIAYQH